MQIVSSYLVLLWAALTFIVGTQHFVKSNTFSLWTKQLKGKTTITLSVIATYSDKKALNVIASGFLFLSVLFFLISIGLQKYLSIEVPFLKNLSGVLFYFCISVYFWSYNRERFMLSLFKDFKLMSRKILFWVSFLTFSYFVYDSLLNNVEVTEELVKKVFLPTILILLGIAFFILAALQGMMVVIILLPAVILLVYIMLLVRVSRFLSENDGERLNRLFTWLLTILTIAMGLDSYF